MASPFSEGLMTGFSVLETIRDRKAARELQNRELSLRELASARQGRAFDLAEEDRNRRIAAEDRAMRAGQARARVFANPDEANDDDLTILEQAGDAESLALLDQYRGKQAFARSLGSMARTPIAAPGAGVTQSPGVAGGAFVPGEQAFLAGEPEALPPDRFSAATAGQDPNMGPIDARFAMPSAGATRSVPFGQVQEWLTEEDQQGLATQLGRHGVSAPGMRHATVPVPPGVLTKDEILALPATEQSAAIAKNQELLGTRRDYMDTLSSKSMAEQRAARSSFQQRYTDLLDPGKSSELRDLAARAPTQFINEYWRDRNSLDPNTRAQMDEWSKDVVVQSLVNLQHDSRLIPQGPDGTPDFKSPAAQTLRTNMERAIALSDEIDSNFSVQDAAGIRGGVMPRGNAQLTGNVIAAIENQGQAARPMTEAEERMVRTQLGRLDTQTAGGSRQIKGPQLEALAKAYGRGWINLEQLENILTTGRLDPKTLQVTTRNPEDDLIVNGVVVERGRDPEAISYARGQLPKDTLTFVDNLFAGLYPGTDEAQVEKRQRSVAQFYSSLRNDRDRITQERGFDPLANPTQAQVSGLALAFVATDRARDEYTSGITGAVRNWLYPYDEQGKPWSEDILNIAREELGDDFGMFSLGEANVDIDQVRNRLMRSNSAEARALGYRSSDEELYQMLREQAEQAGQ